MQLKVPHSGPYSSPARISTGSPGIIATTTCST